MARELHLHLVVVVPDQVPTAAVLAALRGRELPGVPGTWVARSSELEELAAEPAPGQPTTGLGPDPTGTAWEELLAAELDEDCGAAYDGS